MTEPVSPGIHLGGIHNLDIVGFKELPAQFSREELAPLFRGTDLYIKDDGNLQTIVDGKPADLSWDGLANALWVFQTADANKDEILEPEELKYYLGEIFGGFPARYDEDLKKISLMVENRFAILLKNLENWKAEFPFKPLLNALHTYNHGLYLDDLRQSESNMPLNGLTKTVGNILTFIPYNLINRPLGELGITQKAQDSWMLMDDVAKTSAHKRQASRAQALTALEETIREGIAQREPWALEGNLDEALKRLSPEHRAPLTAEVPARRIHEILNIVNEEERDEALYRFAQAERPSFMGYGGGNATGWSTRNWFNYTGRHNNLYFARSVFAYLARKATTRSETFYVQLRERSNQTRIDMLGDGGGLANVVSVGLTNVGCLGGLVCDTTPYRSWGDEDEMEIVGNTLTFGLTWYSGVKAYGAFREAATLARLRKGAFLPRAKVVGPERFSEINGKVPETFKVLWEKARLWKPLPGKALRVDRLREGRIPSFGRYPVSQEIVGFTSHASKNKLIDGLAHIFIIGASAKHGADTAYFNPFNVDHDMNLETLPSVFSEKYSLLKN